MGRITTFGVGANSFDFDASHIHQQNLQVNFGGRVRAADRVVMASGGFDKYGVSASPSEVGTIQLQVKLHSLDPDDMEDKREALSAIQAYGLTLLQYQEADNTKPAKFCYARCTNVSIPQKLSDHSDLIQQATVSFEVPNPIWHTPGKSDGARWGSGFWGTSEWGGSPDIIAATGFLTSGTTTNNGTAITLPMMKLSCSGVQVCQNPIIQRIVNGAVVDEVKFIGNMVNNDVLVIDCRRRSVKLNNVNVLSSFDFRHAAWFRIAPGANAIRVRFDNADNAASLSISYFEDFYGA
jgi:hypothetical protein